MNSTTNQMPQYSLIHPDDIARQEEEVVLPIYDTPINARNQREYSLIHPDDTPINARNQCEYSLIHPDDIARQEEEVVLPIYDPPLTSTIRNRHSLIHPDTSCNEITIVINEPPPLTKNRYNNNILLIEEGIQFPHSPINTQILQTELYYEIILIKTRLYNEIILLKMKIGFIILLSIIVLIILILILNINNL